MIYWNENQQPLGCFIHYVANCPLRINGTYIKDRLKFIWYNQ